MGKGTRAVTILAQCFHKLKSHPAPPCVNVEKQHTNSKVGTVLRKKSIPKSAAVDKSTPCHGRGKPRYAQQKTKQKKRASCAEGSAKARFWQEGGASTQKNVRSQKRGRAKAKQKTTKTKKKERRRQTNKKRNDWGLNKNKKSYRKSSAGERRNNTKNRFMFSRLI